VNRYVDTLLRSYQSQVVAMPTQIAASVSKAQAKAVAEARQAQAKVVAGARQVQASVVPGAQQVQAKVVATTRQVQASLAPGAYQAQAKVIAGARQAQAKVIAGAHQVQAQAVKKAADFSAKLALVDATVVRDTAVKPLEATKKAIEFTFLGAGAHAETSSEDNPFGWVEALPIAEERGGE
jgi:hypothetical protein